MLKTVGAALVWVSCSLMGWRIASGYRQRPRQLQTLMQALRLLRTEVDYGATPLPQALRQVAQRAPAPADRLWAKAAELLNEADMEVADALHRACSEFAPAWSLTAADWEVVCEFGQTLGTSDLVHQMQQFDVALARLANQEAEAREASRTQARLWQYAGVLGGLLLVILFY
ncbi:MAG: hypothetical protein K6T26_07905 [Alicyclobacillus sp.]|nr:hypothetical protein [Alicyclobacillus sp.]